MEKIFSWCTSLTEKLESSNYVEYFHDYFVETAICAKVLGVGLLIALLVALIYYLFVCNRFFALAKRGVWVVILLLTFVASIFISYQMIMGNDRGDSDNSTGIYLASYLTEEELVSNTKSYAYMPELIFLYLWQAYSKLKLSMTTKMQIELRRTDNKSVQPNVHLDNNHSLHK